MYVCETDTRTHTHTQTEHEDTSVCMYVKHTHTQHEELCGENVDEEWKWMVNCIYSYLILVYVLQYPE